MTTTSAGPVTESPAIARPSRAWPLWGLAAGVLGVVATVFTTQQSDVGPDRAGTLAPGTYHLGGALGYLAVACLLVLSACWRTAAHRIAPDNAAARVVADGFTASAAGLSLGYGWKLAMALYLPGGLNQHGFGKEGMFFYYMLNDFGSYLGWLGVIVAAGAVAWLGFRSRLVSIWLAVVSLLPPLAVLGMSLGLSIAGYAGIVGPVWLVVASAGLVLGKQRLMGTR
ncbi:hypothetical protein Mco01_75490 [Microbispora corallina]|uniref:Uncharacterized protein n=1 Tax=Microbispora corallina TaxID=83302 RepID=A0ABQ4GBT0_9ACTN|nr:hypothetical protein Mco01_75490 [Microbispora corallina]